MDPLELGAATQEISQMPSPNDSSAPGTNRKHSAVLRPSTFSGWFIVLWCLLGCSAILFRALGRMWPHVQEMWSYHLTPIQWICLIGWSIMSIHAEGYRGFHKKYCPRVVHRSFYLGAWQGAPFWMVLLGPFFAVGLFFANRKRLIISWCLFGGIAGLVILLKQVAQPWRGIVDTGVLIGLSIGLLSLIYHAQRAFRQLDVLGNAELPDAAGPPAK